MKHEAVVSYARGHVLYVCRCGYVGKRWPMAKRDHAARLYQDHVNRMAARHDLAVAAGERG